MHANQQIEELSLNAWPSLQTIVYDGWLLRFADGYTKRSNCVMPLYESGSEAAEKIRHCEQVYAERGMDTIFKITPFAKPAHLDSLLNERGYKIVDPVYVKTASLVNIPAPSEDAAYQLDELVNERWLDELASLSGLSEKQRETTVKMLAGSPLRQCFITLYADGVPAACGIGVVEQGYVGLYDIVTSERYRNRGLGYQLLLRLFWWAKQNGTEKAYLLVVQGNIPANRLYDKFGFETQYEYWYRVKSRLQDE
ncbi:GNAT family N-acetyltransferase [Paenibacillus glycanilyticus]|uniref:GNAT family N-acetyltransferase n=1 Tax=Paenibacillus glycanilyticus TaxID=126569 RepID=UPI00203D0C1B|nr:GNAT family N-acetyltransferase [Paenibacillus glycanilyticus]MCM3627217.1 GNAT family N-acetyltransferase [Paenibacillus glycanilyticus]